MQSLKQVIYTEKAPAVLGPYSQAIKVKDTVYISGQIPLDPETKQLITGDIAAEVHQVFKNLTAVITAAGGSLAQVVKLTIFLTDLEQFPILNTIMKQYFVEPYPARSTIGVASLPKGVSVEIEAIMVL